MAYHKPETKTIYEGKEGYIQIDLKSLHETGEIKIIGEPIVADTSVTKVDRNGFEITYLAYLFDVFDQLGGQKYKVFKYIIENKSSENTLIITIRELAQKADVSYRTAVEALKLLKKKELISTRTGAIMILPKIAHRGNKDREQYLMQKFREFETGELEELRKNQSSHNEVAYKTQKHETQIPGQISVLDEGT